MDKQEDWQWGMGLTLGLGGRGQSDPLLGNGGLEREIEIAACAGVQ